MIVSKTRRNKSGGNDATFAAPVLLKGEDAMALTKLKSQIEAAVKPTDALEEMWVADIIHLQWELQRLHNIKAQLIKANLYKGLEEMLQSTYAYESAADIASSWASGEAEAVERVERFLNARELTMEAVIAQTLAMHIDDIERIDRMIGSSELRRNNALREIKRHQESLADELRRACEEPQDAEFVEVGAHLPAEMPRLQAATSTLADDQAIDVGIEAASEEVIDGKQA